MHKLSRRRFIQSTGLAAAAFSVVPRFSVAQVDVNSKINVAHIGVGGMGGSDLGSVSSSPHVNIAALVDVDSSTLAGAARKFPGARTFSDYRKMFDEMAEKIDAVVVSTPDHTHAPAAMRAMLAGKHVYCQKPLAHDIAEVRALTDTAARNPNLVTQMGIQVHSSTAYLQAADLLKQGVIGKVKEVYSWSNKSWSGRKEGRVNKTDPVPDNLDWDAWLGVAPERPYVAGQYHPSEWRRWIDFGTGTQGDMACHIVDPILNGLEIKSPTLVWSTGSSPYTETWAPGNIVHYHFAGTQYTTDTVLYHWCDAAIPDIKARVPMPEDRKLPKQGSVAWGEKGVMVLPHVGGPQFFPIGDFKGLKRPAGRGTNHYRQWVNAIRGEGKTTAHFGYSGPLTEFVLMGLIAARFPGEKLAWDAKNCRFENNEANKYLRRPYRKGFEVPGLG